MTWYNARVIEIQAVNETVRRFWLQIPELTRFDFEAGQFVTMDLPIGEKRLARWRSYSIANAPDDSNVFELCIVRSGNGEGTRYLFEDVEVGSEIRLKGPDGTFVLPEHIEKDLVFICTGTGVAPFRSMIQDIQNSGKGYRNIHLIFGTRTEEGLLYRAEFEALERVMPNFKYTPVLSRQAEWAGPKGYVHSVYMAQYATPRPDVVFYLCGWSNMIDEAVANLMVTLGYDRKQIIYELYG
jgi:ferredoxin-NADP reductase